MMTDTVAYIRRSLEPICSRRETDSLIRLLMEEVCGVAPHTLLLDKGKELSETEDRRLREIVARLQKAEPVQYILGKTTFCGLELHVGPSVLIPRPETEELIERITHDEPRRPPETWSALDIGTGSGCIAIALARHWPQARITAADISEAALETARKNATATGAKVSFVHTDIRNMEAAERDIPERFDLIVSNPPYVTECDRRDMEKNVLDYEPATALFVPDDDPLLFYRCIARFGRRKLKPGGRLYVEINARFGRETARLLEAEGYRDVELIRDLSGNDRIVKSHL